MLCIFDNPLQLQKSNFKYLHAIEKKNLNQEEKSQKRLNRNVSLA
jgi:hypothetical protein